MDHFGRPGGSGFGTAARTHRRDSASPGQFGWDGGPGTTAHAGPAEDLLAILLTGTAMDLAHALRLHRDYWTTIHQASTGARRLGSPASPPDA
ncbi:hypothetical protein AB0I81_29595 [Nonomuraea sp. NPDC050404]|uniref:hypothetical protein n=1 Tax=Nonomuraea sp. NPDC050404 TaxID=3155783 RepID=UPI0033D19DC4